jgi:hypothetical protein
LEKNISFIEDLNPDLLIGFYYFLDYEDSLRKRFKKYYEFEDYDDVIQKSEILITASPQAVLENLASGGKPIYIQREDYTSDFQELFKKMNIPIIENYEKCQLLTILKTLETREYYNVEHNGNKLQEFIKENLNL